MSGKTSRRFLLWVDAVGGFMICRGDKLVVGQAVPGNEIDLPIQADLSRRHATIVRDGEGYLIVPSGPVSIDGRRVNGAAILPRDCRIELGRGVLLRFRRPHPLSTTATLNVVSHHRTQPAIDGVLLLSDSCVLGPAASSHIVARNWSQEVMLFRREGDLLCRAPGSFEIDGKTYRGEGVITPNSRIAGENFSLSLETL